MFCPHQEFCCVILLLAVLVASHVVLPAGFLGCWLHYCWGCDPLGSHPGCVVAAAGFGRLSCRRLLGLFRYVHPWLGWAWVALCFLTGFCSVFSSARRSPFRSVSRINSLFCLPRGCTVCFSGVVSTWYYVLLPAGALGCCLRFR